MRPDATRHDPRPEYLRALLERAGVTQRQAARLLGVSERMMRYYVAADGGDYRAAPYTVQYCLEALAAAAAPRAPQKPPANVI